MATADLVNLVNLSLGVEPNGVVNFNYLHTLLHEMVARLVEHESALEVSGGYELLERSINEGHPYVSSGFQADNTTITVPGTPGYVLKKMDAAIEKTDKEMRQRRDHGGTPKKGGSGKRREGYQDKDGKRSPESGGSRKSSTASLKDSGAASKDHADQSKAKSTKSDKHQGALPDHKDQGSTASQSKDQKDKGTSDQHRDQKDKGTTGDRDQKDKVTTGDRDQNDKVTTGDRDQKDKGTTGDRDQKDKGTTSDRDQKDKGTTGDRDQKDKGTTGDRDQKNKGTTGDRDQKDKGTTGDRDQKDKGITSDQKDKGTTSDRDQKDKGATSDQQKDQKTIETTAVLQKDQKDRGTMAQQLMDQKDRGAIAEQYKDQKDKGTAADRLRDQKDRELTAGQYKDHKGKGTTSELKDQKDKGAMAEKLKYDKDKGSGPEVKEKLTTAEQYREKAARYDSRPASKSLRTVSQKTGEDISDANTFTGRRQLASYAGPAPLHVSSRNVRPSNSYSKSLAGYSLAANDISALEKQLVDIEVRLSAVETLPELLSKKASDSTSTPISDMWSFSNMDYRLHAAEKNMDRITKTVDDLLGEIHSVGSTGEGQKEMLEKHSKILILVQEKVKDLEVIKELANKCVSTDALKELEDKLVGLKSETDDLKSQLSSSAIQTDINLVTKDELEEAISDLKKEQDTVLRGHESSIQEHSDSLTGLEKAILKSSGSVDSLTGRVEDTENKVLQLSQSIEAMEEKLEGKLDVSALSEMKGDGSAADLLMPKLLELQNKVAQMETKLDGLPPDLRDQISEMQKNLETQAEELSSLSSKVLTMRDSSEGGESAENLSREMAQQRERLGELDRALLAISSMVTANMKDDNEEEEVDSEATDQEEVKRLRSALSRVQQENERLLGTAAHISHEMEVNKQHIKSLYTNLDDLKQGKADKSHLELQVRDKADRKALDEKASKNWVRSNFEELDRQIREAMTRMMEREEAVKMVNDLNENVDGKVDRLELQPFKDYVEKRLRVKETRKMESRTSLGEDAAGLKKPLRFSCLSCDKPLGIRPHQAVPTLPSVTVFPGSRSFRPYTTFELELIRRQQKSGYPIPIQSFDTQRNARTAGGFHTVTHAYRRSKMVPGPFNAGAFTDYRNAVNGRYASSNMVTQHLESDIVGADGHVYKGRIPRDVKMQSIRASDRHLHHRPTSSPAQTQANY